jgi:hypothetical protein
MIACVVMVTIRAKSDLAPVRVDYHVGWHPPVPITPW